MTGADVDMKSNKNIMNNLFGMKKASFRMCRLFFGASAVCFVIGGCCFASAVPSYSHGDFIALFSTEPQTVELQATSEEYTDVSVETPVGFWYLSEYNSGFMYSPHIYTYYRYACHYRVHNPAENAEPVYMYAKGMGLGWTEVITAHGIPSDADTLYDLESDNLAADLMHAPPYDVQKLLDYIDEIIADCPDGVAASHTHCEDVIVVEPGESAAIYFEDAPDNISALSIPENGSSYSFPRPNQETGILGDVFCGGYPDDEVRCSE